MTSDLTNWREKFEIGEFIECRIVQHEVYGVFGVTSCGVTTLFERIQLARDGLKSLEDYPQVGSSVFGKIVGFRDRTKQIEVQLAADSHR